MNWDFVQLLAFVETFNLDIFGKSKAGRQQMALPFSGDHKMFVGRDVFQGFHGPSISPLIWKVLLHVTFQGVEVRRWWRNLPAAIHDKLRKHSQDTKTKSIWIMPQLQVQLPGIYLTYQHIVNHLGRVLLVICLWRVKVDTSITCNMLHHIQSMQTRRLCKIIASIKAYIYIRLTSSCSFKPHCTC